MHDHYTIPFKLMANPKTFDNQKKGKKFRVIVP